METKKQVVNVTTQEEFNIINNELNCNFNLIDFSPYFKKTAIYIDDKEYGSIDFVSDKYQILTFDEWCKSRGIFVTHDGVVVKGNETIIYYCYKTGFNKHGAIDEDGITNVGNTKFHDTFYYFSTKEACQQYLDNIHKPKVDKPIEMNKYVVMVEGRNAPSKIWNDYELAINEAGRLCKKENLTVWICKAIAKAENEFKITEL